jgi:hypothetical protein
MGCVFSVKEQDELNNNCSPPGSIVSKSNNHYNNSNSYNNGSTCVENHFCPDHELARYVQERQRRASTQEILMKLKVYKFPSPASIIAIDVSSSFKEQTQEQLEKHQEEEEEKDPQKIPIAALSPAKDSYDRCFSI